MPRVAVVGFGYVGCCLGAYLAEHGCPVLGIDRSADVLDAVRSGAAPAGEADVPELLARHIATGQLSLGLDPSIIASAEVILVAVGTPLTDKYEADLSHITAAAKAIAPWLQDDQLVLLKSTLPPGATSDVIEPILRSGARPGTRFHLAFSPERLAEGQALADLAKLPIIVGGTTPEATDAAARFWRRTLDADVIEMSDAKAAETVKIADNLWIDLNIALANELAMLSDRLGVDVLEVIAAANSLPKGSGHVHILTPSVGVGGHCLTKDPWFVDQLGRELGLDLIGPRSSRRINDAMPAYCADRVAEALAETGTPATQRIAALGLAFKSNTGDCRDTPVKPFLDCLEARGFTIIVHDPLAPLDQIRAVSARPIAPDIDAAIAGADCIAFLTGHEAFRRYDLGRLARLAKSGAVVFDGRMYFSREDIARMRTLGLRYIGVGR